MLGDVVLHGVRPQGAIQDAHRCPFALARCAAICFVRRLRPKVWSAATSSSASVMLGLLATTKRAAFAISTGLMCTNGRSAALSFGRNSGQTPGSISRGHTNCPHRRRAPPAGSGRRASSHGLSAPAASQMTVRFSERVDRGGWDPGRSGSRRQRREPSPSRPS